VRSVALVRIQAVPVCPTAALTALDAVDGDMNMKLNVPQIENHNLIQKMFHIFDKFPHRAIRARIKSKPHGHCLLFA
jgi:hypothetical protein